jgi:two-component system, chemotaxis family, chemotaxis protein CheY
MNNNEQLLAPTFLIVDDSRVSRLMIRGRVQAARPDWIIIEAGTADEAYAMVASHSPQFISMDVNMPGITGFDAVEKLRNDGCTARIVMLTANIQQSSRDRALQLNVQFVQKPATEVAIQAILTNFQGNE